MSFCIESMIEPLPQFIHHPLPFQHDFTGVEIGGNFAMLKF